MEAKAKIVISTTSGFVPIDYAFRDRVIITAHSIHYEFKPRIQEQLANISWTARTDNPEYLALFDKLLEAVMIKIEDSPLVFCHDVGEIRLSVVLPDKSKKSRSFEVCWEDMEPCFSIMKQMVRLTTMASEGLLCEK